VVGQHRGALAANGQLDVLRAAQARAWMWSEVHDELGGRFRRAEAVRSQLAEIEEAVAAGALSPAAAARRLLDAFAPAQQPRDLGDLGRSPTVT
jgi:LAO/AO transport system kinase